MPIGGGKGFLDRTWAQTFDVTASTPGQMSLPYGRKVLEVSMRGGSSTGGVNTYSTGTKQQPYPFTFPYPYQQPYPFTATGTKPVTTSFKLVQYPYTDTGTKPVTTSFKLVQYPYTTAGPTPQPYTYNQPYPFTTTGPTPQPYTFNQPYPFTTTGQKPASGPAAATGFKTQPYPFVSGFTPGTDGSPTTVDLGSAGVITAPGANASGFGVNLGPTVQTTVWDPRGLPSTGPTATKQATVTVGSGGFINIKYT